MKMLHTTGYGGEPESIPVDRIISLRPCVCQRFINGSEIEKTPGTSVVVQDASPDGTVFMVRESYDRIIAKLEAL